MNFLDAQAFLESLASKEIHLDLGAIREASHVFGDPQLSFPSVHISGTNGKGSTAAFLSAILKQSGYRVGLYTSPHLLSVVERIQINRRPIPEGDFANLTTRICERLGDHRALSHFEFLTLLAFLFFQEKKVDSAVVETGLGGRLDATNLVEPRVTVMTPISFDHTRELGSTLAEIAVEKCGIIKRGIPTVSAVQLPQVMDVVRRTCDDVGSPLFVASPDEVTMKLGLLGDHQRQNAACAIEVAHLLGDLGFTIKGVNAALKETKWAGRLESVHDRPRVVIDGAHNPAGSLSLASYIGTTYPRERTVLMLGVLADKDIPGIIRPLIPTVREVVCVRAPSKRAASPKDLMAAARSFGATVSREEEPTAALDRLLKTLSPKDTLVIAGSLTMVGAAKQYFQKKRTGSP